MCIIVPSQSREDMMWLCSLRKGGKNMWWSNNCCRNSGSVSGSRSNSCWLLKLLLMLKLNEVKYKILTEAQHGGQTVVQRRMLLLSLLQCTVVVERLCYREMHGGNSRLNLLQCYEGCTTLKPLKSFLLYEDQCNEVKNTFIIPAKSI